MFTGLSRVSRPEKPTPEDHEAVPEGLPAPTVAGLAAGMTPADQRAGRTMFATPLLPHIIAAMTEHPHKSPYSLRKRGFRCGSLFVNRRVVGSNPT